MASQQTVVLMKTSWRCLPSLSSEDVFKTSWSNSLQSYVFKTSWSRPIFSPWPYVFKTFDKVKPSRSGTSLKMSLERRCFLVKSAKFVNSFFAEHHRTTSSDYCSINSSEGGIGKWNRKLWFKKIYVPIWTGNVAY